MVLWMLFAVILFLYGSTCAKTDNDPRRIFSSTSDLMQKGFPRFNDNALSCRYSKLLSVLKENFSLREAEAISFDNVKDKKNRETQRMEGFPRSGSLEEGTPDDTKRLEEDVDFDFLKEPATKKIPNTQIVGCDCKIKNDLLDLGHLHYPRYLLNAVCQSEDVAYEYPLKCWRGAECKPLEYKVRVLTYRSHNDHLQKDPGMSLLPDVLRSFWKFKTVTVAAGCFCS